MATDAEINLKVNIPQPKGPDIEKMLADIKRLGSFTRDYLKEAAKGADIAEAAKIGRERAAKVGEEVAQNWEKGFADGFKNVATMGRAQQKISLANEAIYSDITKAEAAWREGKLTDQQMVALLTRRGEQQNAVYDKAGNLKNMVGGAESDLRNLEQMEELLTKHERFSEAMRGEAEGARALALELRKSAGALEDEAEALDLSIPGNEKRKLQLLQQAKDDRARANAAEKSAEVIEHETAAIVKNIAAVDGSAKSYEKANKQVDSSTSKALDQKKKLVELGAKQAITDQQQIVKEQQLAEQQERRAAAEAKRAKQEEMLREKELYQNSLLGKTKLELAKIISDLNKQRKEAVKIGDGEAIERLNMQYSVARSAMRQASMQANVTRMMFMQQAQQATRLGQNLNTLTNGLSTMGQAFKNGELNISGMASAMTDLWFTFKAGIGWLGYLQLGLQLLQESLNRYSKDQQKSSELSKKNTERVQQERAAYGALAEVAEQVAKQKERESTIVALKADYEAMNTALKTGLDLMNAQVAAELRRQQLTQDDASFQRTLKKHELGRALAEGRMTRTEYELALLDLDERATMEQADAAVSSQTTVAEAAGKKLKERQKDADVKAKKYDALLQTSTHQAVSREEITEYKKQLSDFEKQEAEAEKQLNDLIKKAESQGLSIDMGAEKLLDIGLNVVTLGWGDIDSTGERYKKQLDKALKNYEAAKRRTSKFKGKMRKRTRGQSVDSYLADQAAENEQLKIAKAQADAATAEVKTAITEKQTADLKLKQAQEDASRAKEQAEKRREQAETDIYHREALEAAAKDRAEAIAEAEKDLAEQSLDQLGDNLTALQTAQGGFIKNTDQWNQYSTPIKRLQEAIRARKKNKNRSFREAENEASLYDKTSKFNKLNLREILGFADDGEIDLEEYERLLKAQKEANAAQLKIASEIIQELIRQAEGAKNASKKNAAEMGKIKRKQAR